jgi:ketose-bisphosphate aldolase
MEKQSLQELLEKADKGGYAIPHFNYSDIWDLKAIIEAAEEEGAPIIAASIPKVIETISPEICGAIGIAEMKKAKIPLVHHLDHSTTAELCKAAIDNGYPSVMIDGSKLPLPGNIRIVKEIVEYGHSKGVHVEGEIGKIKGKGYEGNFSGGDFLVDVEEAVALVRETGVDSLAVGIGTAHGFYEGKPEINFKRLAEVNKAVDIPLVLHGGTGIPEEDVKRAIREGINKVNVGTIIRYTYLKYLKDELMKNDPVTHPADIMKPVLKRIKVEVKGWIRACMANGKA